MKYLRYCLYVISLFPFLFAVALYVYYYYNRNQYAPDIPDGSMSHDTMSLYYEVANFTYFLCALSILPGLIILGILNITKTRRDEPQNKKVSLFYFGSLLFLFFFFFQFSGKALTYFYD